MIEDLKPYPQYKDSGLPWLGQVPAHWEIRPASGAFSPIRERNTGMKEKTVLSLSYGRIVVKPAGKLHGLVPESFDTYQIVNPGVTVIRTTDLQNDKTSLRTGIVRDRGIITSAYLALSTSDGLLPEFGYQILNTWDITKAIYGYGSGLRQNLDFSDFRRMPVAVPPIAEQAFIARFLAWATNRLDSTIGAKRRIIALLQEQKQAIIHRAVTRGLDPSVPLKDSGIPWLGEIPEHWEARRLKDVATVQTGITLGKDYGLVSTTVYPYLRVANVQSDRLDLRNVKHVAVPEVVAKRSTLMPGDVLMTEGGDIDKLGRGCLWTGEVSSCLHQNHVFAVRCGAGLIPGFLVALMGSAHGRSYFQITAKQTTNLASTNSTTLKAFPLLLPEHQEQQQILSFIDGETGHLFMAITDMEREITLLREYRTRLIADVVLGKLDVQEVAKGLPEPQNAIDEQLESEEEESQFEAEDVETENMD